MKTKFRRRNGGILATFSTPSTTLEEQLDYTDELLEETAGRIEEAFENGEITEDEAEDLLDQASEDYEDRIAVLEEAYEAGEIDSEDDDDGDGDDDDDGDDAYYSSGTDLATFAAATVSPVAQAMLQLGAAAGYEDVEHLVQDLGDATGLADDAILGLLSGELAPDEDVAGVIADAFGVDDDTYDEFMDIADETLAIATGDYGDDDYGDDDGDVDDATYSRIADLEAQVAEFQTTGTINQALLDLERDARLGVEEGWLPPAVKEILMGEFELDQDRVASFSELCAVNRVTPDVELYGTRKVLEVFREVGPIWAQFGALVEEPLTDAEIAEIEATEAQAIRNHELRKRRKGGRASNQNGNGALPK